MKSIYNVYNEGLLDNIEDTLSRGEEDLTNTEIEHIKSLLDNKNVFCFYKKKDAYTITKSNDKYIVDVNDNLTVADFISDDTFEFGKINGNFIISAGPKGKINSLKGCPKHVEGDFEIYFGSELKDLQYCPEYVGGNVFIGSTGITTLKFFPKTINGNVTITENNKLKSLHDITPCNINGKLEFLNNGLTYKNRSFDAIKDFKKWNIRFKKYSIFEGTRMTQEGILDDIDNQLENGDEQIKESIKEFISENYNIEGTYEISDKPNKKGLYEVSGDKFTVTNKNIEQLTNNIFEFKFVRKFSCYSCKKLKSLEGAPKKSYNFYCSECISLTSLKGAPKEVTNMFNCEWCPKLKSLEGAPKKVEKFYCPECHSLKNLKGAPKEVTYFNCGYCENLESLEGAPVLVQGDFNCEYNGKLKTLKGAPKEVGGTFDCSRCVHLETLKYLPFCKEVICFDCGKQFTEEEVKNWMMEKN